MRGCGLFFARRRTCSPLPTRRPSWTGRELMPALVQVDDDRHRMLDLLFDGVEWVLNLLRARARATAGAHVVPFSRRGAWPSPVRSWAANAQEKPTIHISLTSAHSTKFARAPFLAHAQHRTRSPALHRVRTIPTRCAVTTHPDHTTQHHTTSHDDGRKSLQESRFNSSHLRRERSSR